MFRFITVALAVGCTTAASAQVPAGFAKQHCYDCHSGDSAEAGLDLEDLSTDLADHSAMKKWVRVIDRVEAGEMPPQDSSEMTEAERTQFVKTTGDWIKQFQAKEFSEGGRVRGRRLTNKQLERTLHDLLGIDIPLANGLPDEPRTDGFTTVADGQPMSHFQMQNHLNVIDKALDEAFRRAESNDDLSVKQLNPQRLVRRRPRRRTREPEMRKGKAVVWSGAVTYYGRLPVITAREDGWYRFTLSAAALKKPADRGVWCSVRSGRCVSSAPLLKWVTAFEATETSREWTFEAWLPKGHMLEIRPADKTLKQARFAGGQIGTGEGEPQDVPGLAMDWLKVQRIHRGLTSEQIRFRLLGDEDIPPKQRLPRLIKRYANSAFRRPVTDEQTTPYIELAQQELTAGNSFKAALRAAYRAILCSPRFLYHTEHPGRLDDYAIASRLSYFLWNTMPDKQLMELAEAGKLSDPTVQERQVERMLNHKRGRQFVRDFAHEWLDLSEIDFTQPDRRRHPDFDIIVQNSMVDETHRYLDNMLRENLSVTHLIDSDFTFLNSRLAAFYGIENVTGDELRRVKLKPEHHRGGVLTHGSILKVTANGTNTSPVIRGVWIGERLLGEEVPPPPENVPAIEPDIRGAKTIREQLAKHRSDSACASCHVKIDPPGFALETFDAAGKWRERYFHRNWKRRQKVDPSYQLSDGTPFEGVRDFQKLVVAKPEKLARNVAAKLITYGTGAPVAFADRDTLQRIVEQTADSNYGFRSVIREVIASPIFQNK